MPNETISISDEDEKLQAATHLGKLQNSAQPIMHAKDRELLVSQTIPLPPRPAPKHDPETHPEVNAKWDGTKWLFSFDDKNGKIIINPRQKNLLVQHVSIFISRRLRAHRIKIV